jgi:hypothetical protein
MTDQDRGLAYTRITDTFHLLYTGAGIEAVLFWSRSTVGELATTSRGRTGEAHVFDPAWWLIFQAHPKVELRLDAAPPWDAEADDAGQQVVIDAVRLLAAGLIATYRRGELPEIEAAEEGALEDGTSCQATG